jgi:hypothetical protein
MAALADIRRRKDRDKGKSQHDPGSSAQDVPHHSGNAASSSSLQVYSAPQATRKAQIESLEAQMGHLYMAVCQMQEKVNYIWHSVDWKDAEWQKSDQSMEWTRWTG